jgi:hypothetical protein
MGVRNTGGMGADPVPLLPHAGNAEGWARPVRHRKAHVMFSDGTWRTCQVTGWMHGRRQWFVELRWPDGRSDWRIYDRRYIHPVLTACLRTPARLAGPRIPAGGDVVVATITGWRLGR